MMMFWLGRGTRPASFFARALSLWLLLLAAGAGLRADDLDDFVLAKMKEQRLPGAAFTVLRDGEVLRSGVYGFASLELQAPVTPDTVFQIGSITKQFAARAILMLVDEGKLKLGDSIRKFIPSAPVAWNRITLYHLLTHTSGIPNWVGMDDFSFHSDYTEEQFLAIFADRPLEFTPGSRFKYSSAGYSLLTFVIQKTTGEEFSSYLERRIFQPAGMLRTSINDTVTILPGRAEGYVVRNGAIYNGVNLRPRITAASGAVLSTIEDLARYERVLIDGADLSPASRALMLKPVKLSSGQVYHYGMGWYLRDEAQPDIVYHTGTTAAGFRAAYFRHLRAGISVIFLCNASGDGVEPLPIAETIARRYLDQLDAASQ